MEVISQSETWRRSNALRLRRMAATAWRMLVRREGETLNALMKRLDKAIGLAWSQDLIIDEVNAPT